MTALLVVRNGKVLSAMRTRFVGLYLADLTGQGRQDVIFALPETQIAKGLDIRTVELAWPEAVDAVEYAPRPVPGAIHTDDHGRTHVLMEANPFRPQATGDPIYHQEIWADLFATGRPVYCSVGLRSVPVFRNPATGEEIPLTSSLEGYWRIDKDGNALTFTPTDVPLPGGDGTPLAESLHGLGVKARLRP
jgi:hypothetical protein